METFDTPFFNANFTMELGGIDIFTATAKFSSPDRATGESFDSDIDEILMNVDETQLYEENREEASVPNEIQIADRPTEAFPTFTDQSKEAPEQFTTLDKSNLLEYIDQGLNKNTRRKTEKDASLFLEYLKKQGETRDIIEVPSSELDAYIGNFFVQLTKANGNPYEPSTITSIHR